MLGAAQRKALSVGPTLGTGAEKGQSAQAVNQRFAASLIREWVEHLCCSVYGSLSPQSTTPATSGRMHSCPLSPAPAPSEPRGPGHSWEAESASPGSFLPEVWG